MEQVEQIEQTGGNKQTPVIPECKYQCRSWVMTWNNYPDGAMEQIEQELVPLCEKYVFGKERGDKCDTPHIQGAFILKTKKRQDTIWKLLKDVFFLDKMKGKWDNQKYCAKEDPNPLTNVKFSKPLKKLACEDNLYDWQQDLCKVMESDPDDRTIYWYWSKAGNIGKTTFAKYLHRKYGTICLGGKSADMKNGVIEYNKLNGCLPESIVINIPRSFNQDYVSYTGIEEVKDMFFYSGKYEGGMVDGNSPHLIIFSNEEPREWEMSPDRWVIREI